MRVLRLVVACMLGIGLYQASVIYAGGLLAAITVPQSYFEWFGHSHNEEALALLHLGGYALPIALLVAGGTLSVQRLLSPSGRDALYGVLAGLVLCAAFWLVAGLLAVPQDRLVEPFPLSVRIRQILLPPWWILPNLVAPWIGFLLAVWLIRPRLKQ